MKKLLAAFLISGIFTPAVALLAAPTIKQPEQIVRETSEEIVRIINTEGEALRQDPAKRNRLVHEVLLPVIDFNAFARLTLGRHWRTATAEQRATSKVRRRIQRYADQNLYQVFSRLFRHERHYPSAEGTAR